MTTPEPPASPQPTPYAATGPAAKTNTLAIIALILGIVVPIGGIIVGHIALSQIKKTGEAGRGLALTGTILGYVFTALFLIIMLFSILVPLMIIGGSGGYTY